MLLMTMALACCGLIAARADTQPPGFDTTAVYAQIVAAVRAEQAHGAAEKVFLAEDRPAGGGGYGHPHGVAGKHSKRLLREMVSRRLVDGVFTYGQRDRNPCPACRWIVLGPLSEFERPLYIDPKDLSREVGLDGVPVRYFVNAMVVWSCTPESIREGWCTGTDYDSRRFFFSRQPNGTFHLEAWAVTGVP
jgi:hypothetical protein